MNNCILTVGEKGFLLSNILKNNILKNVISFNDFQGDFSTVSELWFFGTPIDSSNVERLCDYSTFFECLKVCQKFNIKMVYASSYAVLYDDDLYAKVKSEHEEYIRANLKNYLILRLPRIYDKTRNAGLMKLLKENKVPEKDMSKEVTYCTLNMFLDFIENVKSSKGIVNYPISKETVMIESIQQIKNRFC
jgi:hypothetical protein